MINMKIFHVAHIFLWDLIAHHNSFHFHGVLDVVHDNNKCHENWSFKGVLHHNLENVFKIQV
jgi:hypothetical protein